MVHGYKAFYRDRVIEVQAETTYEAQVVAAEKFKARKSYEVSVVMCEKNGVAVPYVPVF